MPAFLLFSDLSFHGSKAKGGERSYIPAIFVPKRVYSLSLVFSYVPRRRVAVHAVFLF